MESNFDKTPTVNICRDDKVCFSGWEEISQKLSWFIKKNKKEKSLIIVETYHGVDDSEVETVIKEMFSPDVFYHTRNIFKSGEEIEKMVFPFVTDDRVFGYMTNLELQDYLDDNKLEELNQNIIRSSADIIIVYGPGSSMVAPKADLLLYFDMPRWEIQQRMRKNKVGNLGILNEEMEFSLRYKQAYFNDWRILDKHKITLFEISDFFIDTTKANDPKMLETSGLLGALHEVVKQPFRVVPFFDPGVWGGQWLKEVMNLDRSKINYAWGFDCVPEENSLLLQFDDIIFETPSLNLVFREPEALLGKCVYKEFGAEFPIRFDFLDTVKGGNLSLQVHPTNEYIKEKFGMSYTQDESYYILDAKENACVYLGLQENVNPTAMISALKVAQDGEEEFEAEKYVNKWDIKKHGSCFNSRRYRTLFR